MSGIKKLQEQRKAILDKAEGILALATDETPVTPEQASEAEKLMAEVDGIDASINAAREAEKKAAEISNRIQAARKAPDDQMTRKIVNLGGLAHGVHASESKRETTLPRGVRRASVRNFKDDGSGVDPALLAYRFGMWAIATISETKSCGYQNQQAVNYCMDQGLLNISHGEAGADTTGSGVLVPEEFGTSLILLRENYGAARRLFNVIPMSSDTRTEPRQLSTLTAYFTGENSAGTESNLTFDNVTLVAKKLMVLARMSNELNADNAIALGDRLIGEIAWAFANKEDECAFNGDGTSTYGGMTGVRSRLAELTAGTAPGLVLGSGNLWSELTLSDFNNVAGVLPQYADIPGAAWVCHKTFYYSVMQKLALAAGGTQAIEVMNGVEVPVFLGYPVVVSQVYPSTQANSQIPVTFGAYNLGAKFGNRGQEQIAFSTQAVIGGESMWERDQIGVRGTERFDIIVHDYGTSTTAGPIVGLQTAAS